MVSVDEDMTNTKNMILKYPSPRFKELNYYNNVVKATLEESKGNSVKQLLDEVEHDIFRLRQITQTSVLIIHDIMRKPNSII